MRFIVFAFSILPAVVSAAEWETVAPIKGDPHVLLLPYNAGTIRTLLDERCGGRVACVAAVPLTHPKRLEYAEHWYRQCMTALDEARRVSGSPSWTVHDLRAEGDEWLAEPLETVGAELVCDARKSSVETPFLESPNLAPEPPVPEPLPAKPTASAYVPDVVVASKTLPRARDTVEFAVAAFGESWFALARGELDGLGAIAGGIEVELMDALLVGLRAEVGSSERGGTPYLWVGGLAGVSTPLGEMIELGGFVRWHSGLLGPEPNRDRLGTGVRVVIMRLIADNLGLELLVGAARDLTPAYRVPTGRYTDANDLTLGLAVGVVWLPFL